MSISSETRKAGPYAGNGVTTNLPFSFKVFSTADVRVVQTDPVGTETDLTLTTHYTVSLNADQDANPGGTVIMVTAPATGYYTTLTSRVQNLQAVTITNLGGFYPKILNDALDRLTIMVQQVAEQVSRAVKVGISSSSTPDQLIDAINTAASTASAAATSASGSAASASASAASASASASAISTYPASVQSQAFTRFTAGGTADAIAGTLSPAIASYAAGLRVTATPGGANTVTGPTLNLNSLGAKTIKKRDSSGSKVALVAGDYNASGPFDFEYDGTDFILLNPLFHNVSGLAEDTTPDTANDFALVWDASASAHKKVKLNKIGAAVGNSMVRLNTANGYGSTNTKIRRFTNTVTNTGSDITYADSATLGASFTINTNGVYAISYSDTFATAQHIGISLNTSAPTTNLDAIPVSEVLSEITTAGGASAGAASWVGYLPAGSVVRAHNAGAAVSSPANSVQFTITRVA